MPLKYLAQQLIDISRESRESNLDSQILKIMDKMYDIASKGANSYILTQDENPLITDDVKTYLESGGYQVVIQLDQAQGETITINFQ